MSLKKRRERNGTPKHPDLDLLLEIFMTVREPDREYSTREIAAFLGCTHQLVYFFEQRALLKLRSAFSQRLIESRSAQASAIWKGAE